MNDFVLQKVPG